MLMGGCQSIHQPFVCLSVPRLSVAILTVRLSNNRLSPFHQSTARLSVHPSVYPLLFFSTSTNCPSSFQPPAARLSPRPSICLSVRLPTLSCFSSDSQSPFRPQTVRLSVDHPSSFQPPAAYRSADCSSVCLSICLPALVFPPTVCHRFDHQLPLCLSLCPLMFFLIVH